MADDSKNAMGLGGISNTVTSINKDILQLASTIENTLLPKVNALSAAFKGMGMGGGGGGVNQVMSGPGGGNVNRIAMGVATAGAAIGAMPNVPTSVMQDFLTQRSVFYGLGSTGGAVNSFQRQLAKQGTALNSMDSTNAIIAAQNAGLGGVSNFNNVMAGAAQASNLTPGIGITGATQAIAGTMNAPTTVNLARTIGINIRGADGSMMPFPQLVDKIWAYLSQNNGGRGMNKKDMQYSMQPGYGLYNMLNGLFNGDPTMIKIVSDALLAKATFSGQSVGTISKDQMVQAGIQSATVRDIASQTAAQTSLLTATSSATAGGYAGAADIGTGMNNLAASMSDLTAALGGGKGLGTGVLGLGGGAMGNLGKAGLGIAAKSVFKDVLPKALLELLPILGLALAEGGDANAKVPYIVGEKGPELFVPKTDGTVIPNHLIGRKDGGDMTSGGFAKSLLNKLSINSSPQAIADVAMWEGLEGGNWQNTAKYNPLNTSYQMSGSTNFNTGKPGSGVQAYASWQQGIDASVGTLTGKDATARGYTAIINSLKSGASKEDFLKVLQASNWDAGKYKGGAASSSSSSSANTISSSPHQWNPSDAERFQAQTAAAFGSGGGGGTNYGGFTININGITDPSKVAAAVKKILQNPAQSIGKN
jgi:hypothetical protein